MKKHVTRLLALLLVFAMLLQAGCTPSKAPSPIPEDSSASAENPPESPDESHPDQPQSDPDAKIQQEFLDFTNSLFLENVTDDTVSLHYTLAYPENFGIEDYDITLGSLSRKSMLEDLQYTKNSLKRLTDFPYDALSEENQLTYDVLKDYLETTLEGSDYYYYQDLLSPVMGIHSNLPVTMAEYAFRTERDIENYLMLMEQLPAYLDEVIAFEKTRAKNGFVMSSHSIRDVIDACQDFVLAQEENILISTFNDRLDAFPDLDDGKKEEYKARNQALITEELFPAYERIIHCLRTLESSGEEAKGLSAYPDGKSYYSYLLKAMVGSGHTPEELLALIEERVSIQSLEMYQILSESPELADKIITPLEDPRSPEEILEILKSSISEDYPALPAEAVYQVKYVHESMEESTSPAFYMIPPIDALTENTIYINQKTTNGSTLFSTLAHEGYPGHLYQTVYASSVLKDPIRDILNYPGYVEGWGLYVEHESYAKNTLMTDQSEDLARLYALNSSVSISIHALLDINIHYNGWGKEETKAYAEQFFGPLDDETLDTLYYTIVSEPAYYLKYYAGYLEILLLREKAEARLEENFDLKEFHKFLLEIGPCSFPVIDRYMEKWMSSQP